ncbi:Gfo/Idh/MocA family protein [Haloferula sp. A504]|uniref:Gfo/Idh/MocA family protein n=1 Tax=Haloferula sp. A504 TaxID=3373601 RepID=UPI0031BDEB3B|nr:Gfo/Idh/MocA family oxidoreductase [Verrucomicrobiaceae bacterium E54]
MEKKLTRRKLLKNACGAGTLLAFPSIVPSSVLGDTAPSKKIALGFIGMGSQGTGRNLGTFLNQKDAVALAVCDARKSAAVNAKKKVDEHYKNRDCSVYQDFRELIARKDIDAVVISTPDHWHIPMSMAALKAGKDVFCEKPSLTITEGRELAQEVARREAVFQWGIEDRSLIKYHRLAGWVRDGAIGKLEAIHVSLPTLKPHLKDSPAPVPDDLDWNLWLGPAPFRPYTPTLTQPNVWRTITDYSGGSLTDWGSHLIDTAQVGAGMDASGPVEVSGSGVIPNPKKFLSNTPGDYNLNYRYSNHVEMFVKDGGIDIKFVGTDGWVRCEGWNGTWSASSKNILRIKEFKNLWPLPPIEHRDFLDSMKTRKPGAYHVEAGHRLATALHLGHLAIGLDTSVQWDPDHEAFVGNQAEFTKSLIYKRSSRNWENV